MKKSQQSHLSTLVKKNDHYEISAYKGELTEKCVIENTAKITTAFPALKSGFYDIFQERIKENKFSDKRLIDAVNHVIGNCIYPTPTIAQFLSFDNNVKIYSYDQMLTMNDEIRNPFQFYTKIDLGHKHPMYVNNRDFENNKHLFKEWLPKK